MTITEIQEVLRHCTIGPGALQGMRVQFHCLPTTGSLTSSCIGLMLQACPTRDGAGGKTDLTLCKPLPLDAERWREPLDVVRFLRSVLHELLCHEADEALLLDGIRVFDPHATPK